MSAFSGGRNPEGEFTVQAFVGRTHEITAIRAGLERGTGAWVCGPRGIGVSATLRAISEAERALGLRVVHAVASAGHEPLRLAVDILGASTTVAHFGRQLAEARIDLLVIDDVHRADDDSIEAIRLAVLNNGAVVVAGTTDRVTSPALTWLASSGALQRIELLPLGFDDTTAIVAAMLGRTPDGELVRALVSDSAGRPAFMIATLDLAEATGAIVERAGLLRLADELPVTTALRDRIGELTASSSPAARAALETLCLAGSLPLRIATTLFDLATLTDLESLHLIHVETHSEPMIRPVTRALGRAIVEQLGHFGRLRLAAELVERAPDAPAEQRTWWRHLAGQTVATPDLVTAAREWRARGDLSRAQDLADAAWRRGDVSAAVVLSEVRSARGHRRDAADLLEAALDKAGDDVELTWSCAFELATLRLWNLGDASGAVELAAETAAKTANHSIAGVGHASLASMYAYTGRFREALVTTEPLLDDDIAAELALQVSAVAHVGTGDTQRGVDAATRGLGLCEQRLLGRRPGVGPDPEIHVNTLGLALVESGRLAEAAALIAEWYERGLDRGLHSAWMALARTRWALAVGDLHGARRFAREAAAGFADLDHHAPRRWALAGHILASCALGDDDAARTSAGELDALGGSAVTFLDTDIERCKAWLIWRESGASRALASLRTAAQAAESAGHATLASLAWHDLARIGDAQSAVEPLRRLEQTTDSAFARPRRILAEGLVARDADRLLDAAEGFGAIGAMLAATEAGAAALDAARERGDRRATRLATAVFQAARRSCPDARTPLLELASGPDLSPREREIAGLAAEGRTSRAIAEQLGVSNRTVDNLLQRVYAKLGVAGRSELREAWVHHA